MKKLNKISEIIGEIHQSIGNRIAGSREEKLAARYIKNILGQFSDEVSLDSFRCNSRSEQQHINLLCIFYMLGLLGYLVYPPSAIFIIFITGLYLILVFFYDIRIMDVFFSDDKSQNVIAKINPTGEIKQKVIFSAHTDSPYVNKIYDNRLKEYAFYFNKVFIGCFASLLLVSLLKVLNILSGLADYLYLIPFLTLGIVLYLQNNSVTYDKSFGANNDLSGIAVTTALAKYFYENKTNYTQIYICNFGAKEACFSGAKNFLKKYFEEIKDSIVINLESIAGGTLFVVNTENNVKHSEQIINILLKSAENISLPLYKTDSKISTDARIFSYEKISAVSLLSLDKNGIPLRYCLKDDLPVYISEEDLQNTYKICIETVKLLDERTK